MRPCYGKAHGQHLHLAVLDLVGSDGQSLVDGDEVTVLHAGVADGPVGGVVGQGGELGEGEGRVGLGAALNELEGGGVDGRERDGGVLGNGPSVAFESGGRDPSLVPSLHGQDGTGDGDVGGGLDGRGGSQVGRDTDRLEDRGDGDERGDVGDGELVTVRRGAPGWSMTILVLTGQLYDSRAGLGSGLTQGARQELDVLLLVSADLGDSASSPARESSGDELLGGVLVEVLLVEGVLQVLQGPGHQEKLAGQQSRHRSCSTTTTHKAYWRTVMSVTALCLFSAGAAETKPMEAATAAMAAMVNFIMN